MRNQKLLRLAQRVQGILECHVFDSAIVGGLPRDMKHSLEAKDADIAVYNYHPWDSAEGMLMEQLYATLRRSGLKYCTFLGLDHQGIVDESNSNITEMGANLAPSNGSDDSCMIPRVIKVFEDDIVVDIIFYADDIPRNDPHVSRGRDCFGSLGGRRITSVSDVLNQFDSNMNQYLMVEGTPVYMGQHPEGRAVHLTNNLSASRVIHFAVTARKLGWDVHETDDNSVPF